MQRGRPGILVETDKGRTRLREDIPQSRGGDQVGVNKVHDVFPDTPVFGTGFEVQFLVRQTGHRGFEEPGAVGIRMDQLLDTFCSGHAAVVRYVASFTCASVSKILQTRSASS